MEPAREKNGKKAKTHYCKPRKKASQDHLRGYGSPYSKTWGDQKLPLDKASVMETIMRGKERIGKRQTQAGLPTKERAEV